MITQARFLLLVVSLFPGLLFASENKSGPACCRERAACCKAGGTSCRQMAEPAAATKEPVKSHPLRGVIVSVNAERAELTVKHEAIPGVMRAMTMVFKVDAATAQGVREGEAITANMARIDGEWWLFDVRRVPGQSQ